MTLNFKTSYKDALRKSGAELKCTRTGTPCVIVGCAPHLDDLDLTVLDGTCDTFVCNRFFRSFPVPEFRPDYYVCADRRVWRRERELVEPQMPLMMLGDVLFDKKTPLHDWVWGPKGRIDDPEGKGPCATPASTWFGYRTNHQTDYIAFSDDPDRGFYQAGTVAYDMLQWAAFMGFNPIGIVGVDLRWPAGADKYDSKVVTHAGGMKGTEHGAFPLYTDYNLKYFAHAAQILEKRGIRVVNLAPGGALNVFPREDFRNFTDKLAVR